ncbi:hypothetical protein EYF80_046393 [Liparis tanakae]|uniref:Uncharacterized protein n=1 Tax=Liparis tanakae TaxID=230148 RepID=A0A4Z2FR77_9TELE|nr:hypothetical protein EYF80_046393 [Liparis tanakae]
MSPWYRVAPSYAQLPAAAAHSPQHSPARFTLLRVSTTTTTRPTGDVNRVQDVSLTRGGVWRLDGGWMKSGWGAGWRLDEGGIEANGELGGGWMEAGWRLDEVWMKSGWGAGWRLDEGGIEAGWRLGGGWMEAGWRLDGGWMETGWRLDEGGMEAGWRLDGGWMKAGWGAGTPNTPC